MAVQHMVPAVPAQREGGLLARVGSRIADRRRDAQDRRELASALAGDHGPGVQAEVRAALER